ncbi:hypothetical protein HYR82_02910 [Candidatus Peregrinibacteria bacterium]|nr:hypothetical protein [Candidatus Peregrinibacteria bacterium]
MHASAFRSALLSLIAIPLPLREKFIRISEEVPEEDRERILERLTRVNADLEKNEQEQIAVLKRGCAMQKQLQETDIAAFVQSLHA